jgi:hypothetical protein
MMFIHITLCLYLNAPVILLTKLSLLARCYVLCVWFTTWGVLCHSTIGIS